MPLQRRGEAEQHIGSRADLQRDAAGCDLSREHVVVQDPDPVAQTLRAAGRNGLADAVRACRLSRVVDNVQSGRPRCLEYRCERVARIGLVSGQADRDHPIARMRLGQSQRCPGPLHRPAARVVQQQPGRQAVLGPALRQAVHHRSQRHLDVAEPLAVRGRGERHLRVGGALGHLVGAVLDGYPVEVLVGQQAVADQLVRREERCRIGDRGFLRNPEAPGRSHLGQGLRPDRALQVHVQVRLRQGQQITHLPKPIDRVLSPLGR